MKLVIALVLIFSGLTVNSFENNSDALINSEAVVEKEQTTTMRCIAAGSCKFKFEASCRIVYCDGEVLEDDSNSTVDKDKIIIIETD